MTHGDGEAERRREGVHRREHAWAAGLGRLAEELEAFTERLVDAQRALSAAHVPPAPRRPAFGSTSRAARRSAHSASSLRERLDATERLVAHLEQERRRDGAARVLALTDAAGRLEHAQQVIEVAQRRLTAGSDSSLGHDEGPLDGSERGGLNDHPPADLLKRAEHAVLRVEEFETQLGSWENELGRQADLLERVAQSCQQLEADLATRDEIELHIATLIERLSHSIARAPAR